MAKPIRALELHYPLIQCLIMSVILVCGTRLRTYLVIQCDVSDGQLCYSVKIESENSCIAHDT